ncbi:glycoside hydrolase family 5 protein, partial [Tulasnella calospora MUT 4182]
LNWIRLPIPFWAIEKYPDEPFLEKVAWKYALKAFKWARKYGLRVNLDLHTIPGSQNGYNHSGKGGAGGQVNFLHGPMGLANAQRTLDYIRIITEFISQPEYAPVVPMFGFINEALAATIGVEQITSFYVQVHDMIREITGRGQGKGPFLSIHDSFRGLAAWKDLMPGHDRVALDVHPYLIFVNVDRTSLNSQIQKPCRSWAADMNSSWTDFGVSMAGEFSLAINDCGLWINGVGAGTRWEGTFNGQGDGVAGSCAEWNDWQSWTQDRKDDFRAFALRNFDALGHWFFWTWKIVRGIRPLATGQMDLQV